MNAKLSGVLRVRLNTRDQVICRAIFSTGEWEPNELEFLRATVKPGMVAFDVGANIGVHTLTLARCVGPGGMVHAFEPTAVFETLAYNVHRNGFDPRVRLNHCAVGESDGTGRFLSCRPGSELFTSRGIPLVAEVATGQYVDYPMTTLDAYVRQHGIARIDFLKVDVEGAEDLVLQGCGDLLAGWRIGCIMFELNEVCMANNGRSAAGFLERIRSAGYHLSVIDEDGAFRPVPESLQNRVFNIVATPQPLPFEHGAYGGKTPGLASAV
jgi:FkbM family methyltransferase